MRLILALAVLCAANASAVEFSPLYELQVLGGQNFYSGQKGNLSGNVNGTFAPAAKLSDRWALLPTFNSAYSGTQQVIDVVGGQTLFQMQWDNLASLKGIYTTASGAWRLKPAMSFKYELLKESNDEQLGKGLFDYRQWDIGGEAEWVYNDPFSVHAGIDYYRQHFPNYTSLESQAATSIGGQALARELIGDYVIDTDAVMVNAGFSTPLSERYILEFGALALVQTFPEQHVVDASDALTGDLRRDVATTLTGGLKMPRELNSDLRLLGSLDLSGTYNSSNQNSYDATQTRFIPYFYNYGEVKVSPALKLLVGPAREPVVAGLSFAFWHRLYAYRPVQDAAGVYQGAHIYTNNWMLDASLRYPMSPQFALVGDVQYGQGASNQRFEQYFRYRYGVTNYWFGFSYKY